MKKTELSAEQFVVQLGQNGNSTEMLTEFYQLSAFRLIHFKAFHDTNWIKINHLTLILGENSSGKSALYQALGMLSAAYHYFIQEERFNDLARLAEEFGEFDDICNKSARERTVRIGFEFLKKEERIEYWIMIGPDEKSKFGRVINVLGMQNGFAADFLLYYHSVNLFFMERKTGLMIPPEVQNLAVCCLSSLRRFAQSFQILAAHRYRPERVMQLTGRKPDWMSPSGSNAYDILYFYSKIENKNLYMLENWMNKFGYSLCWKMSGINQGQLILKEITTGRESNLIDNGFGISQSIPLALALDVLADKTIFIDTPEAFLQTKMQSEMGDLLVEGAKKGNILAETGSEYLTLRIRRRIAEGKISNQDVSIYYLEESEKKETVCREIILDEDGEFQDMPESFSQFFSSDFQDIEKIDEIRRKKIRDAKENRH